MHLADLRASWTGLTSRGTSFLTAGVVALACALLLGQTDLVRVAGLLVLLPVVVVVHMALLRLHLLVSRTTDPARGTVGGEVEVQVEVVNRSSRRTPVLLFEDQLAPGLEGMTRVVLPPMRPGESARVAYRLRAGRRGRFAVGPSRLVATEPFGLLERSWEATARNDLLVRPLVHPLPRVLPVRRTGRGGDSDLGGAGVVGEPDLHVREYREGDDLRRVHWPTTARRGELMVRPDQHPQDHNAVVLLDSRADGQRGGGPSSTLELLTSAAASVLVHAADLGHRVVLLGDDQESDPGSHDSARRDEADLDPVEGALDRLALLGPTGPQSLADAVEGVPRFAPSLVVALLGEVGPDDVQTLAGAARDAVRAALVCVGTSWEELPAARARLVTARHEAACAMLADAGWRVVEVRSGDQVRAAWEALDRSGVLA